MLSIVEEIRNDPEKGAKRLESEYKVGLMSLARRFCADESDAEALVNRTFAIVVEKIDSYLEQSAFFGWMSRILVNCHSKDVRRKSNEMEFCNADIPEDAPDDDASARIFREVDASILRDAIDRLPKDMKQTLLMHYFMDMPVREVAKVLSVPSGTIMWRLHYARQILAAKLGANLKKPVVLLVLAGLFLAASAAAVVVGTRAGDTGDKVTIEQTDVRHETTDVTTAAANDLAEEESRFSSDGSRLLDSVTNLSIPQGETQMNIQTTTAIVARTTAKAVAAAALALGATAPANAADVGKNVFSDAAVWFKGAYDRNSTLGMDYKDLRNALDLSTELAPMNAGNWGQATNCVVRYEDVICPYAGTVMSNVPCFYMPQAIGEDGKLDPRHFYFKDCVSVTNCEATVVMRVRPECRSTWITGELGFLIGFSKDDDGRLMLRSYCGKWQNTNFKVDPGVWIDVAVVGSQSGMKFYAVTNNGALFTQSMSAQGSDAVKTNLAFGLHQSGYSSWSAVATNSSSTRVSAFCGSIQSFAVWNRRLSDVEVREAMAFPRADIMRIGVADGAGGEFIKASPDGKPVNADDWYGMPAALAPGESVDIAFWLKDYEHTLPQVLRLTSAQGSSGGLHVSVNGTALKKVLKSVSGATKTLFIPGNLFISGSNTLHLANNSPGTVMFDALALGGSWQVGYPNGARSEFAAPNAVSFVEDGNWKNFRGIITSSTTDVSVVVSPELAASGHPAVFNVSVFTPYAYSPANYPSHASYQLLVNGKKKLDVTLDSYTGSAKYFGTISAEIAPGELKAGTNMFSIACQMPGAGGNQSYFATDYLWLAMKNFPKGMIISFK